MLGIFKLRVDFDIVGNESRLLHLRFPHDLRVHNYFIESHCKFIDKVYVIIVVKTGGMPLKIEQQTFIGMRWIISSRRSILGPVQCQWSTM